MTLRSTSRLVVVAVCIGAAMPIVATAARTADPGGLALSTPFPGGFEECIYCSPCTGGHKTFEDDGFATQEPGAGAHACIGFSCAQNHPPGCRSGGDDDEELFADLENVRIALAAGDTKTALQISATNEDLVYVASRNAIQAYGGCARSIIAHVRLP